MNCQILVSLKTPSIHVVAATALARPIEGIADKRPVRSSSLVTGVLRAPARGNGVRFTFRSRPSASFTSRRVRESIGPASAQAAPSFS